MIESRKVIDRFGKMFEAVLTGFQTHNTQLLHEAEKASIILGQEILQIRDAYYIENLDAARNSFAKLTAAVEEKVAHKVLFSEAAVKELRFLFEGFSAYLCNINDFLITKNEVLRQHIKEETANYTKCCRDFATKHEERLIKGVCQPRSSSIYLNMLDGIGGMFYNLGQLADK